MASLMKSWNRTTETFLRKGFSRRTVTSLLEGNEQQGLRKVLGLADLTLFGIGAIIGAGVFVLTGEAAKNFAGPSIILSYLFSSITAVLLAMSYVEFAVELPITGGAFNYIRIVYGEFLAWLAGFSLVLEYTLGAAAVAKGFSGYFASLCGLGTSTFVWESSILRIDFFALLLISTLCIILTCGMKESSSVNMAVAVLNVCVIIFILLAAVGEGKDDHFENFTPEGIRGTFRAAGVVFFAYIGFDSLANMASEVKNPQRDLPVSIVGSILFCTFLYMLMAAALIGLESYEDIDESAPYSEAFIQVGMRWAGKIVSIGALTGIITSVIVSLISQSRIYLALANEGLLPSWISVIHEKSCTPRRALLISWVVCGLLGFLFDIDILSKLVSMGTLFVLTLVSLSAIQRMYTPPPDSVSSPWPIHVRLFLLITLSILEGATFALDTHPAVYLLCTGLVIVLTCSFYYLPVCYTSEKFVTPLKPFTPALASLCGIHLMFSLGWEAHLLFLLWQLLGFIVYIVYGMHHTKEPSQPSEDKEAEMQTPYRQDGTNLIENDVERSDAPQVSEPIN